MLRIYEIDLHYHGGQERARDKSLEDYLAFAAFTGRRVLGITDHIGLFQPADGEESRIYPRSLGGLLQFREEFDRARDAFPEMRLFFAPELYPGYDFYGMDERIIGVSDYFICEPPGFSPDFAKRTEALSGYFEYISKVKRHTGRPAFMAHPFRSVMPARLAQGFVPPRNARGFEELSEEEICAYLGLDLRAFSRAAVREGISVEINAETHSRARTMNVPFFLDVLWGACRVMKAYGVSFVPASDLHGFRQGRSANQVPADCFSALGVGAEDIPFLREIGAAQALQ